MTTIDDTQSPDGSLNSPGRAENTKPVTILLAEDTLRKLKMVAIMKSTTGGELLAEAAVSVVKRDLKKGVGKTRGLTRLFRVRVRRQSTAARNYAGLPCEPIFR